MCNPFYKYHLLKKQHFATKTILYYITLINSSFSNILTWKKLKIKIKSPQETNTRSSLKYPSPDKSI